MLDHVETQKALSQAGTFCRNRVLGDWNRLTQEKLRWSGMDDVKDFILKVLRRRVVANLTILQEDVRFRFLKPPSGMEITFVVNRLITEDRIRLVSVDASGTASLAAKD